ncbi:50S ribosomal protein L21 [Roseovarius arcticus]|uniref:50S ribosomal protein L21 n=1 Tax=Roseovarius arcticus TaxID=2547404 RepID=UPI001110CD62|nr:50S ribosomal protein L21 [Roseovarius arcticus]
MFAVLKTGGKQYRVKSGDMLRVEKLAAEAGETIQFNEILMLGGDSPIVGAPLIGDACVQAEVIDQIKGDKVIHFVKRRRKHSSKRTKGHRQQLTLLRITDILGEGAEKSGVKAAIGAGSVSGSAVVSDGQYAKNKGEQAEMKKRVKVGEAEEKSAETKAPAKKAAPKKAAPAKASGDDDLKKLSGVGPALEKKLHENGVTSFAQIAKWSDADVAEMDEKLSFKGRIEREGWIDQAKELAKG